MSNFSANIIVVHFETLTISSKAERASLHDKVLQKYIQLPLVRKCNGTLPI